MTTKKIKKRNKLCIDTDQDMLIDIGIPSGLGRERHITPDVDPDMDHTLPDVLDTTNLGLHVDSITLGGVSRR